MGTVIQNLIKRVFIGALCFSPSYIHMSANSWLVGFKASSMQLNNEKLEELHEKRISHKYELLGKPKLLNKRFSSTQNERISEELLFPWVQNALPKAFKYKYKEITRKILDSSLKLELDPLFVMSVVLTESSFNPLAQGTSGEIGLMQLLPDTAKWISKKNNILWRGPESLKDPETNIEIGTLYLSYLREKFSSHARLYISAYNMGPTNVKRALRKSVWPKEYALRIMDHYKNLYSQWSMLTSVYKTQSETDRQPASVR